MAASTAEIGLRTKDKSRALGLKPPAPVKFWAFMGLLVLYVIGSSVFSWVTGEHFKPSPVGDDPLPLVTLIIIRCLEFGGALAALTLAWLYLLKPWISTREISWDGKFLIVCFSMWILDPMDNYFNFSFSYNAHMLNMASWAMYLPGWESPRQNLFPEPLLMMGGMYVWFLFGFAVLGCWVMRKSHTSWFPNSSILVHLLMVFLFMAALDLTIEVLCCRYLVFVYGGAYYPFTLWAGEYYQFPLYEPVLIGVLMTGLTAIRYFRDDKGQSFAEKGLEQIKLPKSGRNFTSFLAVLGFVHVFFFVFYFMPYNWMALKADSYPELPSYMTYEICGEGTDYACPSREVPIPSLRSLAIPPDDPRLSDSAKRN